MNCPTCGREWYLRHGDPKWCNYCGTLGRLWAVPKIVQRLRELEGVGCIRCDGKAKPVRIQAVVKCQGSCGGAWIEELRELQPKGEAKRVTPADTIAYAKEHHDDLFRKLAGTTETNEPKGEAKKVSTSPDGSRVYRLEGGEPPKCETCEDRGIVYDHRVGVDNPCPDCGGTGKKPICNHCNGSGVEPNPDRDMGGEGVTNHECTKCGGASAWPNLPNVQTPDDQRAEVSWTGEGKFHDDRSDDD